MPLDIRGHVAEYYDLSPEFPDDLPFYERLVPSPQARILELGCGTGRILIPLSKRCERIYGVDASDAMISVCRTKLASRGIPPSKASVHVGDITSLRLQDRFDLIIAPFRVFQNLESDEEVKGFFKTVRDHISDQGTALLNAFRPSMRSDEMRRSWCSDEEKFRWEVPIEGGRLTLHDRRAEMDPENLVLYPELVYRRYKGDDLVDEATLRIAMRCYYPSELLELVRDNGFEIVAKWGGYHGEEYGQGSELVVQYQPAA